MSQSNKTRFTRGEARCAACGGVIRYELSESRPRFLKNTEVPCSGCPRDYQLEVVEDAHGTHVRAKGFTERG